MGGEPPPDGWFELLSSYLSSPKTGMPKASFLGVSLTDHTNGTSFWADMRRIGLQGSHQGAGKATPCPEPTPGRLQPLGLLLNCKAVMEGITIGLRHGTGRGSPSFLATWTAEVGNRVLA